MPPFRQTSGSTLTNTRVNQSYLNSGLELVGGNSFSGTSVQITSFLGATPFTSKHRSYRLVVMQTSSVVASTVFLKLRTTVDHSANYYYSGTSLTDTAVQTTQFGSNVTTGFRVGATNTGASNQLLSATIDILMPNENRETGFVCEAREGSTVTTGGMYQAGGFLNVTTQFTDFSLVCASSITGVMMLYGWRS